MSQSVKRLHVNHEGAVIYSPRDNFLDCMLTRHTITHYEGRLITGEPLILASSWFITQEGTQRELIHQIVRVLESDPAEHTYTIYRHLDLPYYLANLPIPSGLNAMLEFTTSLSASEKDRDDWVLVWDLFTLHRGLLGGLGTPE